MKIVEIFTFMIRLLSISEMYNSIFVASVFLAVFSQSRVTNASNFNPNVEENDLGNTMLEPGTIW